MTTESRTENRTPEDCRPEIGGICIHAGDGRSGIDPAALFTARHF